MNCKSGQIRADGGGLQEVRRRTHAAVAQATEEFDVDRLDEQAATLAHHWEQAGDRSLAAKWHARAALWAMRTDTDEAYRHWTRVVELARDGGAETAELLGSAYVALVNLGWRVGRSPDETRATFDVGRRLFEARGDHRSLALLLSNFSLVGGVHGSERVAHHREAMRLAEQDGDLTLRINVGVFTFPLLYGGLLREAHELADATVALIETSGWTGPSLIHFDPRRWIYASRGWTFALLGDIARGLADSDRGLELARQGDANDLLYAENLRCALDGARGEFGSCLQHARRSFELAEHMGGRFNSMYGAYNMGIALNNLERWAEALKELAEARNAAARARELAERMEYRLVLPKVLEAEAEIAWADGDASERSRLLREARAAFEAVGATGQVRRLARVLGE